LGSKIELEEKNLGYAAGFSSQCRRMGGKRALAGALNPNYPPKINQNPQKWNMGKHIVEEIVAKSV